MVEGPGKRGSLSPEKAATSEVSPIKIDGESALGYMKGTSEHILPQFIIRPGNDVALYLPEELFDNYYDEMLKLKNRINSMGEKYVPVEMEDADENIYVTYFDNKVHIGSRSPLQLDKIKEVKDALAGEVTEKFKKESSGQLSISLHFVENLTKICLVAAKTAINTLAYIRGAEYVQTENFNDIIHKIMSMDNKILDNVVGLHPEKVSEMRRKLHLTNGQQFCILTESKNKLKAWVAFYDYFFEITLCEYLKTPSGIVMDGVVCDWKNKVDYKYLDYITNMHN